MYINEKSNPISLEFITYLRTGLIEVAESVGFPHPDAQA